jgi:hypothetical protein
MQVLDGNHAGALASLRTWASANGMATVRQNTILPLSSVHFNTLDGTSTVEVQLVDPNYKTFLTKVDFSVNNLQLERNGPLPCLALKKPKDDTSASVDSVCSEIVRGPPLVASAFVSGLCWTAHCSTPSCVTSLSHSHFPFHGSTTPP